jgi:hypothetical protein
MSERPGDQTFTITEENARAKQAGVARTAANVLGSDLAEGLARQVADALVWL